MESIVSRFRNTFNLIVLAAVLVGQIIGLAVQVKRPNDGGTRLIRVWAIGIVTPITRTVVHTEDWFSNSWHTYVWLRGVRQENEQLKDEIAQMKMQQIRLVEDASQAQRLQLLLGFKEPYIEKTVPAQVISTTGSEFSRAIYIDKGSKDGIGQDMAVITPQGIVGKVLRVMPTTSLVLLINDPTSGAGVILQKSRLQGILKGSVNGATMLNNVMSDEKVEPGDSIITSGGDRIFPKGLPVGTVATVAPGQDLFYNIRVRPAANLNRLEEVLVLTKIDQRAPDTVATSDDETRRAIDILAQRLPTVQPPAAEKPASEKSAEAAKPGTANASTPQRPAPELTKTAVAPQTPVAPPKAGTPTPLANASDAAKNPKPVKEADTAPAGNQPAADGTKGVEPQ